MAHPDVALDVEGRGAREPEGLHVGVDDRLIHVSVHAPRALEFGDQLLVDGAAVVVDQLDLLVGSIVGVAVIHHDVETVCRMKKHKDVRIPEKIRASIIFLYRKVKSISFPIKIANVDIS